MRRVGAERRRAPTTRLFAATLAGSVRTVMSAPGSLDLEDIAPDGRVLVAHGSRRPSIMALAPGATEESELTWMDFSWVSDISDDGRQILFAEQGVAGGPGYAVYLRGTDRSPAVRLGQGHAASHLSPDGQWALAIDLVQNTAADAANRRRRATNRAAARHQGLLVGRLVSRRQAHPVRRIRGRQGVSACTSRTWTVARRGR